MPYFTTSSLYLNHSSSKINEQQIYFDEFWMRDYPDSATPNSTTSSTMSAFNGSIYVDDENTSLSLACNYYSSLYPDYNNKEAYKFIFYSLYTLIFVLGITGNSTMLYVTLSKRAMITVQNVFLMNLAVSDIVVCLVSVPVTPVVLIYKEWYFGKPLCHLIMWVLGSSIFISTLTLTAIALDRYMLVVYPHKPPPTIRMALCIIIGIWLFSGIVTLPYAYFMRIVKYDGVCGEFCDEKWPSDGVRRAFTTIVFACQFVVPFTIMCCCYATILNRLKRRLKYKMDRMFYRESEKAGLTKRKRRSTFVLACMVLIFGLTWLPQNVISMISNYAQSTIPHDYVYFVYLLAHCFAMLSILANPVLYAWLNSAFRKIITGHCARWRVTLRLRRASTASGSNRTTTGYHPELCTDYLMRNVENTSSRNRLNRSSVFQQEQLVQENNNFLRPHSVHYHRELTRTRSLMVESPVKDGEFASIYVLRNSSPTSISSKRTQQLFIS